MQVTIFEGPEGGGKTTLLRTYREHLQEEAEKAEKEVSILEEAWGITSYPFKKYTSWLAAVEAGVRVTAKKPDFLLIDRFYQTHQVLDSVLRTTMIKPDEIDTLERWLEAYSLVVVYCLPPLEVCLTNVQPQSEKDEHSKIRIYRAYEALYFKNFSARKKRYSITFNYQHLDAKGFSLPWLIDLVRDSVYRDPTVVNA